MNWVLFAMIAALLIPIYEAWQDEDIWQTMLAFASIATKTSIMILVLSVLRDDWTIGVVGVLILSVGNASLMLLAHIIKRVSEPHSTVSEAIASSNAIAGSIASSNATSGEVRDA